MAGDNFYEPLKAFRNYLMHQQDAKGVDACNEIMARLDKAPKVFIMSEEDVKILLQFMFEVGYISHEFHAGVHDLTDKLSEFVKANKDKK